MGKKLVSLSLVLLLAGLASASATYWVGIEGDWEVGSNWNTGQVPTGDVQANRIDNTPATINVTQPGDGCGKLSTKIGTTTLNIQSGASLTNDGGVGSTEIFNNIQTTININGTFAQTGGVLFKFGGSGSGSGPTETINIDNGGLMSLHNSTNNLQLMLGTYATGTDIINVYGGGELDTDTWVFTTQPATSKLIKIYGTSISNTGKMVVYGNQTGTADLNNKIIAGTSGQSLIAVYDAGTNKTTFEVPEPITIALLGLGGLLLRRKK